ncbi:lytic murein transglycosylase [Bradyrhizobium sp. LB1.3]
MPQTRIAIAATALLTLAFPASAQFAPPPAKPAAPRATAPSPRAASCHNGANFDRFLADVKQQAVATGVSQRTMAQASPYLVYDQGIVNRDRGQRVFGQLFTEFAGRMAAPYRMQNGQQHIKRHAAAFARAEKEYGVPPAVIAAFWGLESDFGVNMGNLPTLKSLVSLAYDCRRSEMFVNETIAALKIIDRGDLTPDEMIGSWAGELGQTQFLPVHYVNYAVDYDGDGRRDLLRSEDDVIGSTANYIANGLKWPARRAVAGGDQGAAKPAVGSDRSHRAAAAREMGAAGGDLSRRQAAAERQSRGLRAAADGTQRAGLHGVSEFRGLYRVE